MKPSSSASEPNGTPRLVGDVLDPAHALSHRQIRAGTKLNDECACVLPSVHLRVDNTPAPGMES